MTYLLIRAFRLTAFRCLRRVTVSGGLLALAALLFALDHNFSQLTWGAIALAAGAILTKDRSCDRTAEKGPCDRWNP